MQAINLADWEVMFQKRLCENDLQSDPAHDYAHFQRVVRAAKSIALKENARLEVVVPAAWLHDLVNVPKNDPRRAQASTLSADAAIEYLTQVSYPEEYFTAIHLAIRAHSFSARIDATTLEAKIVQDADRLDAVGAIGIARCLAVGGMMQRPIYDPQDPFAQHRLPDDGKYTIDHFFTKLFKIKDTLQTRAGREEGEKRVKIMRDFLDQLGAEI
jgi:uncharacterized protein